MNGANVDGPLPAFDSLNKIDQWILTRLNETIAQADEYLENFEFAKASELIYHFAWDDLCDWYLELTKSTFAGEDKAATARVLGHVLDQLLRLLHPSMPFITEQLWCNLTGGETLVTAAWPVADATLQGEDSIHVVTNIQEIITEIRRFRNDQGIKTSAKIVAAFSGMGELAPYEDAIRFIVRTERADGNYSAKIEVAGATIEFDLTGAIDIKAERARLSKDLATAQKDLATAKIKLENEVRQPLEDTHHLEARCRYWSSLAPSKWQLHHHERVQIPWRLGH